LRNDDHVDAASSDAGEDDDESDSNDVSADIADAVAADDDGKDGLERVGNAAHVSVLANPFCTSLFQPLPT
jgi:hypothetical protein